MKRLKNIVILLLTVVLAVGNMGTLAQAAGKTKPTGVKMTVSAKTVYVGDKFELKAKMTPAKAEDDYLCWSITGNTGIVRFTDKDLNDDEVELKALKAGTTKIECRIKGTDIAVYTTVTVKKPTYKFSRVESAGKTVTVGTEFELKVKKSGGLKDNDLKWSIKDTGILKFTDKDITDDEVELKAKKAGTTTVTCTNLKTKKTITYTITVKKASPEISKVGSASKTVYVGKEFELEVKKTGGVKDSDLKWSIKDTGVLKFADKDITDDEVELKAKKAGTTTVTCTNLKTKQTVTYTIKVVKK